MKKEEIMCHLIDYWEKDTELKFCHNGPELIDCEHCGKLMQFISDHDCWGMRAEAAAILREDDQYNDRS